VSLFNESVPVAPPLDPMVAPTMNAVLLDRLVAGRDTE